MSVINELFSAVRKGRMMTKDIDELMKYNTKSIAKRAQDSTFQFACLIPTTLPLPLAATVTKNMDRVYASFVQTVIASDPLIDISIDRGPIDYIRRMHQNLRLENVINEAALNSRREASEKFKAYMESECKDLMIPDELYESTITGAYAGEYKLFMDPTGTYGVAFTEHVINDLDDDNKRLLHEHLSEYDVNRFPVFEAKSTPRSDVLSSMLTSIEDQKEQKSKMDMASISTKTMGTTKILETDAKRFNELQPYGLQVRLMAVNDKKEFVQFIDFIVGIKAVMHLVKPDDIVDNLARTLQNKNPMFNFVRWTTGEISLFKDLMFHMSEIKHDMSFKSRNASPFFPNLKRMKDQKFALSLFGATKLVPNATIVLTSFEVDDLMRRYGLNIRDITLAKKVIRNLFLMTIIIVDEGSETMDILYESSTSFETYALETLEREMTLSSNKIGKEIGRMISQ